jgi:hypothetical protein
LLCVKQVRTNITVAMVEPRVSISRDSSSVRDTPRRTQEQRRGDAEKALLDSATRLFALYGLEQTSLGEIGEKAGYSRGLANHHSAQRSR